MAGKYRLLLDLNKKEKIVKIFIPTGISRKNLISVNKLLLKSKTKSLETILVFESITGEKRELKFPFRVDYDNKLGVKICKLLKGEK